MHINVGEAAQSFPTLRAHRYHQGSITNSDAGHRAPPPELWPNWSGVWGGHRRLKISLCDSNVQPGLRGTAVCWPSLGCMNLLVQ